MSADFDYKRVKTTKLYETQVPGSIGWAAYVLPELPSGVRDFPASISTVLSLLLYQGHYCFSIEKPPAATADPDRFVNQVMDYVADIVKNGNRGLFWLKGYSPVQFGKLANFGFEFSSDGNNFIVHSDFTTRLGKAVEFFAKAGNASGPGANPLVLSGNQPGELRLNPLTQPGLLGFRKGTADLGITVGDASSQIVRIPLCGPNAACMVFGATINPSVTFSAAGLGLGFEYTFGNVEQPEHLFYPGFNTAAFPGVLSCTGAIDPSDPVNTRIRNTDLASGYLRTGFGIAGTPALSSSFRTAEGRIVSLVPVGLTAGALSPSAKAGAFAMASESQADSEPGESAVYLAPAGSFGISVEDHGAGSQQELICAFFGSERLTFSTYDPSSQSNDLLLFLPSQPAYAPIFPFQTATLENPESGSVKERLSAEYLTSWATIAAEGSNIRYIAQPEGSPLYAVAKAPPLGNIAVLVSSPPSAPLPQGIAKVFPIVPYAGLKAPGDAGATLTGFESQIIAPTRKTIISGSTAEIWSERATATLAPRPETTTWGTTPQGFLVESDPASGAYFNIKLAQSSSPEGLLVPFQFERPTTQVQTALQTNQLFLVAVNDRYFDDPNTGAVFTNTLFIADWTMRATIGKGATPTSYRNVMIIKFCSGTVADRAKNPNQWTDPKDFSLVTGSDQPGSETLAFTGLSQWLQEYIDAALAQADGRSAAFYRNFKRIVTDETWNGVIVFQADLSADALPAQIQGLAAGIDFTRFTAHHFGFTATRVKVDEANVISMQGISSLFGLIDYTDPRYAANLVGGQNPDAPIPVETSNDFNFTVLQLQSLFDNARLVDFKSSIQLTVARLYGSNVLKTFGNGLPMPANGVVLDGSYIDQNGATSYVFQQSNTSVFALDSNVLQAVAFNRTQFNTLGERDDGATVASRFLVWGTFDFVELRGSDGPLFDIFSFGSPAGTMASGLGQGLSFSNLVIGMSFPATTPSAQSFAVDTDNMAFDLNASSPRDTSLFKGFGLQLKTFINASGDQTPADLGFLAVTSQLNLTELGKPWFGIAYQVTLGGPGALASAAGFTSNLLTAWSPSTTGKNSEQAIFIGLSLPGAAPGAKLLSLEGVFRVSVGSIALIRQPVQGTSLEDNQFIYCLRLDDIGIKIFGIVKLPPDATIQFFMFGDPANTGSQAWYAAYVATSTTGAAAEPMRLVPLDDQRLLPAQPPQ